MENVIKMSNAHAILVGKRNEKRQLETVGVGEKIIII